MPRNIDRRVEVLFPVEDPTLIARLRNELLDVALADTAKARELRYNGSYVRVQPAAGSEPFNSQEWFMRNRNAAARRHTASRYRL